MYHVEWTPSNVTPEDGMPILISFEDCRYPNIGYYSESDGKFIVEREEFDMDDIPAENIGKVNGWTPLPTCKDYIRQKLSGVISHIDPVYNTADIIVFNDDDMRTVIVKEEMISGLYEGDPVVVELINGVPTRCFEVTYVAKL